MLVSCYKTTQCHNPADRQSEQSPLWKPRNLYQAAELLILKLKANGTKPSKLYRYKNWTLTIWTLILDEWQPCLLFQTEHDERQDEHQSLTTSSERYSNHVTPWQPDREQYHSYMPYLNHDQCEQWTVQAEPARPFMANSGCSPCKRDESLLSGHMQKKWLL